MLSPFRYMKEVIHLVFSNCRKTKCIKSNRRSDWSTGTRRRIFKRNRLYGQDIWPNMFHRMLTMRNLTSGDMKISRSSRKTGKLQSQKIRKISSIS